MKNEYTIKNDIVCDKKFLKQYITSSDKDFDFPCKITVFGQCGSREYYVEESNVNHTDLLVFDWHRTIG